MHEWGSKVGKVGGGLVLAGILGMCTATALIGAGATVMAWRWFRFVVGF